MDAVGEVKQLKYLELMFLKTKKVNKKNLQSCGVQGAHQIL